MFLALLLSASSLEALRFTPAAIIAFRILAALAFAGLAYVGFARPLRRQVSDNQVAMYLEECDPTLQAQIMSAVETSGLAPNESVSPRLVERLVEQAIDKCRVLEDGLAVERQHLKTHVYSLAGVAAFAVLLIVFGPAFLRHGLSALVVISRSAVEASPYRIEVTPGDTKIPRGADQTVNAQIFGFTSPDATLMVRNTPDAPFEKMPLIPGSEAGKFEGMLFHVEKTTDYYVESNGVKSKIFKMSIVDLPVVEHLVTEYKFPAYTELQPRTIDPGGDVAALKGTDVLPDDHPDDEDGKRARADERRRRQRPVDGAGRRHADRQLQDRSGGLLQDRARWTAGREGCRVAAVHD